MDRRELIEFLRRAARDGGALAGYDAARVERAIRTDAIDFVNLVRDFETRILTPYRDKFQELRARDFIPTNTDGIQSMSETWMAQFLSQVGTAELVVDFSDDLPVVQIAGRTFGGKIGTFGAAAMWSVQDVLRASMGVVNLPMETLTAGRLAIDTAMDQCLALGAPKAGINGFLTHPEIDIVPLDVGNWGAHTAAEVVADFMGYVAKIRLRTNYVESSRPDTVLLDPATFALLAAKLDGTSFGKSALTMLREAAGEHGIKAILEWSYLANAGTGGTAPRCVIYKRDPKVVSAVVALEYYQLEPQRKGLTIQVPALARCGGTVVIEPRAVAYFENPRA